MPRVDIPLDPERIAVARAELSDMSDDAVVYLAGLVYLAAGMAVPEGTEGRASTQAACVRLSDTLINGKCVPPEMRDDAYRFVEHLFSFLPARLH